MNFLDWQMFYNIAKSQLAKPYQWGAKPDIKEDEPLSFDCSGYVRWVYGRCGVVVPEGSEQQYLSSVAVTGKLQTGDVGFFLDSVTHVSKHVGILLDGSSVIEARGHEASLEAQGVKSSRVILRPRDKWEGWKEFSGWRRFQI